MKDITTFDSWRAFSNFEREVRKNRRFVRTSEAEQFLDAVRRTIRSRQSKISKGRGFWRAQIGHAWRHLDEIDDDVPSAFLPERMKPQNDRAMEGRANPKGIPMLYLCTNKDAAMSEVRPWLGSLISVGYFEIQKNLLLVDCTRRTIQTPPVVYEDPGREGWDSTVWSEIDRAFTTPVTRTDDTGDYVATQILVELFRDEGFDGIAYRSAFGERSTNLALFDLECAELKSCQLHEVTNVKMNFVERDNPYWVKRRTTKITPRRK
jgi:hypothetical protein